MAAIFNCDIMDLPVEVTLHKFISLFLKYNKDLSKHLACIKSYTKSAHPIEECRRELGHKVCPKRFGTNLTLSEACQKRLNGSFVSNDHLGTQIETYKKCAHSKKTQAQSCLEDLKSYCKKHRVRSVKTVRLRMMHAERLLAEVPDLRVVHVVRDPRAVVRSRIRYSSYSSLYSNRDPVKEAKIFCEQMAEDVKLRHQLEKQYPERILTVLFEVSNMLLIHCFACESRCARNSNGDKPYSSQCNSVNVQYFLLPNYRYIFF